MAFATILAVVAGLTITAAASFAHDVYASVIAKGKSTPEKEMKVARRTVLVIGVFAIAGGIGAQGQNVAFLVALAFAVAASANLPTMYSRSGRGSRPRCSLVYGGLGSALLIIISRFSGSETSMIPSIDMAIFPLANRASRFHFFLAGSVIIGHHQAGGNGSPFADRCRC
ncbi:sodium:solute symporter family transporter [Glutamicibacter nicotianae]|uniref:sodium:solute symporter family transporter n=1 Tax=Glutamicibacter nicotianae TaxID=37929 RepID=UPI0021D8D583|nr:hypothetical protein [Glutamicibacter nicotianae]